MAIIPLAIEMRRGDRHGDVEMRMPTNAMSLRLDVAHMRKQQRVMEERRALRHPLYIIAESDGKLVEHESNPTDGLFLQDLV